MTGVVVVTCGECDTVALTDGLTHAVRCGGCGTMLRRERGSDVWATLAPQAERATTVKNTSGPKLRDGMVYDSRGRWVPECARCAEPTVWKDPDTWGSWVVGEARRVKDVCKDLSDHQWQSRQAAGVSRAWDRKRAGAFDTRESGHLCIPCRRAEPTWQGKRKAD